MFKEARPIGLFVLGLAALVGAVVVKDHASAVVALTVLGTLAVSFAVAYATTSRDARIGLILLVAASAVAGIAAVVWAFHPDGAYHKVAGQLGLVLLGLVTSEWVRRIVS